ncbi:MAG TPA: DUF222 domain-containing protein [Candidatus Dormibacteraeota bacterium]|nr:DUF222 domain-containing protein [Candidatus Dormibacteraeota bacterium]
MASLGTREELSDARLQAAVDQLQASVKLMSTRVGQADGPALGEGLIQIREAGIDPLEAVFADGVRRFDRSGEYAAEGALSIVNWLRWKCKLSGGAAAERVGIARQLDQLPKTEAAFARGDLGYQHVALIARTAEHVGAAAVRSAESSLLQAAQTHDPGQFAGVTKDFEHRVDAEGALAEANRAYARRYLHLGEPQDGLVRLDGLLDAEGGAVLRTALNPLMMPSQNDERTPGQRRADALVGLCRRGPGGKKADGAGPRPQLIITASVDTLAGLPGAPAARLESGATIPSATVQRLACDAAITRITGLGEFDHEISQASRSIPAATRRALAARDQHCVFASCDRPPVWCDGHHLVFWTKGGPTTLPNLALVCQPHHRKLHEEGWTLERRKDGRLVTIPPSRRVMPSARSA